jgi:pyruvate/2-oxoglutarate dehydrogenase complex dihydrolipoamide acyltransferase (E2) component
VAVGGIVERPCVSTGQIEAREHLCLSIAFNHDIVDGAPAARFVKRFSELLMSGELLANEADSAPKETESQTQGTNRI